MQKMPSTHVKLARKTLLSISLSVSGLAQAQMQPQEVSFTSRDGTPIKAWLMEPTDSKAAEAKDGKKLPTVIALHGCGGLYATTGARQGMLNARHQAMAEMLVGEGYRVLLPDSLTPRGEVELCTQKIGARKIDQTQRRVDALGALQWVAQQPWADAKRVAVLGWSHGGSAVLASVNGKHPATQAVPERFAQAIAFYPGCAASEQANAQPNAPLAMMLGALDDWTPPEPCERWGKAVGAEVNVYPNSYHDFDNPQGRLRVRAEVPNGVKPGKGVTVGPNPEAREKAYLRVKELLKAAFSASATKG